MHGGMMAGMGLWMLVWGLLALVLLVLAVLGIVALVRHLSTPRAPGGPTWQPCDEASRRRPPTGTPS
jgi:hypothetical protein